MNSQSSWQTKYSNRRAVWGTRSPTHRHNNNRQTMNYKTLVKRFAKACYRFEALQENLDILLFDTDDEIKYNEYEDLASQAAEIVLKLSANGHNVGEHFFNYYVRRLEYIVAYFRELFDDEETSLAEDEQDEQDDEPTAEGRLEGFPADCAFPKSPTFFIKKWAFKFTPTAKAEENAAEEDDGEDEQPDNENDTQAAECDETADDTTAGAPISDEDILRLPYERPTTGRAYGCWEKLTSKERTKVRARETLAMWCEINDAFRRKSGGHDYAKAYKELDSTGHWFYSVKDEFRLGLHKCLFSSEKILRKKIEKVIDAIPGFRDSEEFKTIIEKYPTYKEKEQ